MKKSILSLLFFLISTALIFAQDVFFKPGSNSNTDDYRNNDGWDVSQSTYFNGFLTGTAFSQENYDASLQDLNQLDLVEGVTPNLEPTYSYSAPDASKSMMDTDGLTIADVGAKVDLNFAPFVTTWEVSADDLSIFIPTAKRPYDFTIDWGDGTTQTITGSNPKPSHRYKAAGTYTVSISGNFPSMFAGDFYAGVNNRKLRTVEQWGDIEWQDMRSMFRNAQDMTYNATDVPNLSEVISMREMFSNNFNFNGDINNWDVSNVRDMSSMFRTARSFNQDLNNWDVSKVINMHFMFLGASSFNGNISNWDVSSVTDMNFMFSSAFAFNQDLGSWNISKVVNMNNFLQGASVFSQDNYDALLVGWSQLDILNKISFTVDVKYSCAGVFGRQALITNFDWTISDGGLYMPIPSLVLDENNQASITEAMLTANCGDYTVSASPLNFDCANLGINETTIEIADNLGNSVSTTIGVSVVDNTPPEVVIRDFTVALDENGEAVVTVDDVITAITDNCSTEFSSFFRTESGVVSDLSKVYAFGFEDWYNQGGDIDYSSLHSYSFDQTNNTISDPRLVFNVNEFDFNLERAYDPIAFDQDPSSGMGYFIVGHRPRSLLTYNFDTEEVTDTGVIIDGNASDMTFDLFGTAYVWIDDNIKTLDLATGITTTLVAVTQGGGGKGLTYDYDNHRLILASGGARGSKISIGAVDLATGTYIVLAEVDAPASNVSSGDFSTFQGIEYIGNNNYLVSGGWWSYMFGLLNLETLEDGSIQPSFNVTVPDTYLINPNQPGLKDLFVPFEKGSISLTFEGCEALGEYTYELVTRDASGNTSLSNVTIKVIEDIAPTIITQDITVELDENGEARITAAQIDNGSSDNCGIESLNLDIETFDCSHMGTNTVILTVTDASGNEATGTATVTVVDNVPPVVLTQDITVQLDANGEAIITQDQINNGSNDNCGGGAELTFTLSQNSFTEMGTYTVTLIAVDASGNSANADATVTVEKSDISSFPIESISDQIYVGSALEPSVVLKDGNMTLIKGTDYEVTYSDNINVGTATVIIKGIGRYRGETSQTFIIMKAQLTITANDNSKTYGEANPVLTFTYAGLVNGDEKVTTEPGISTAATAASGVGTYPITLTGGADDNYDIILVNGSLEITQASLIVTANANQSKAFGMVDPVYTYTVAGFVNNDSETILSGALDREGGEETGSYAIRRGSLSAGANYNINFISADFLITAAEIEMVFHPANGQTDWGQTPTLPNTVGVMTTDGQILEFPVSWNLNQINVFVRGEYPMNAVINLRAGYVNPNNLTADIVMTVLPKPGPRNITLDNNTFRADSKQTEIRVGVLTVEDAVDNIHTLELIQGTHHSEFFTIRNGVLFWNSSERAEGRTHFRVHVKLTDRDGNVIEKVFTVERLRESVSAIEIFNSFTPNGDGNNDTWGVSELRFYSDVVIQIFERSGKRLFYTQNPDIRWDGTYENKELPTGTYYWVLEVRETGETRRGMLNLLRK
ncbi:BspA family leucine-rich repeat surface protein [Mongoliibacter sp.]|uniref:BspA family leucine-rich repeat surface protein n=1 Tax=Mongoliibacter sp. TaxID=2022438 RepID=UPI0025F47339|nr:BspA family leucine-rich repeat surface protein [Mongoliibacter sp.]